MKFASPAYHKEMQGQLRDAAKGTGWKQAKGAVFRQIDDWFIAGHWRNVSANPDDGLRIEIMAKPMVIDAMLWDVMELHDNNRQPLSFRYWGAFICGNPVLKSRVIDEFDPEKAVAAMLVTLDLLLPEVLLLLETSEFSDLARNPVGIHDNWRMEETITHALRLEEKPELALKYALANTGTYSHSTLIQDPKLAGSNYSPPLARFVDL